MHPLKCMCDLRVLDLYGRESNRNVCALLVSLQLAAHVPACPVKGLRVAWCSLSLLLSIVLSSVVWVPFTFSTHPLCMFLPLSPC